MWQVLGARKNMQAELTGSQDTTLQVEMYWPQTGDPDQVIPGRGVARDNPGNLYKVAESYRRSSERSGPSSDLVEMESAPAR
jgi:hypothetical protein